MVHGIGPACDLRFRSIIQCGKCEFFVCVQCVEMYEFTCMHDSFSSCLPLQLMTSGVLLCPSWPLITNVLSRTAKLEEWSSSQSTGTAPYMGMPLVWTSKYGERWTKQDSPLVQYYLCVHWLKEMFSSVFPPHFFPGTSRGLLYPASASWDTSPTTLCLTCFSITAPPTARP